MFGNSVHVSGIYFKLGQKNEKVGNCFCEDYKCEKG